MEHLPFIDWAGCEERLRRAKLGIISEKKLKSDPAPDQTTNEYDDGSDEDIGDDIPDGGDGF